MRALVLMAGEGSRFKQAGYTFPKPLIETINGKTMIELVLSTLPKCDEYIFMCRQEHLEKYHMEATLRASVKGRIHIIPVETLTDGAARTALLSKSFINDNQELLIVNSDQYVEFSHDNFQVLRDWAPDVDGVIFTFTANHPKWSFVKHDEYYQITQVAEKEPISNVATCGLYWFRRGDDFVFAAEKMIEKNIRVNNEFYLAPCYNELIESNRTIIPFWVNKMAGLGTPEDLQAFLNGI